MRVRLRAPDGQHTVELADGATVGDLKAAVHEKTAIEPSRQELLCGFPPKPLAPADGDAASCSSVGIANGESVTVRESAAAAAPAAAAPTPGAGAGSNATTAEDEDEALARAIAASLDDAHPPAKSARVDAGNDAPSSRGDGASREDDDGTVATRRVIDSDNSCLFNAVGYVMNRSLRDAPALRKVIADVVSGDAFTYNDGFLGKPNAEYCRWILESNHWGGAVELSILAKHFKREIAAYDIQTKRCDVYGQGEGYPERVMLLYDGLHYDAMVLTYECAPHDMDITMFPSRGPAADAAGRKASKVVNEAHAARQFTDTANFTLRCLVCQKGLKGEKEALEHAKASGHSNFSEY